MPRFGEEPPHSGTVDCNRVADELLADQYVLGQLTAPEAEAFEDHYMTCPACAEEVESAELTAKGFKRLAAERVEAAAPPAEDPPATVTPIDGHRGRHSTPPPRRRGGLRRAAGLLAAAFAGAVLTLPMWLGQSTPADDGAAVSVFHLQPERSVAAAPSHRVDAPGDDDSVVLALELSGPIYESYAVALELGDRRVWEADGLAIGERDTLHLQLPRGLLAPGDYTLVARGLGGPDAGADVGRFAFRVE